MNPEDIRIIAIMLGILVLCFIMLNLYIGIYFIILTQLLFVQTFVWFGQMEGLKYFYAILFVIWFGGWVISHSFTQRSVMKGPSNPLSPPCLAFLALLVFSSLIGLLYGAPIGNILRDLSQYIGYLSALPVFYLVRTPRQAKGIILFLGLLGLPSSLLADLVWIGGKQKMDINPALAGLSYAAPYWGPIQGAAWAVAVSATGVTMKLLAWGWIILRAGLSIFSGFRHMLLIFVLSAMTAFIAVGKLAQKNLTRYLIPVFLLLSLGALLADLSGAIKLPLSEKTRERYGTLLSEERFLEDDSIKGRVAESKGLLHAFLRNPLTGIGLGHSIQYRTAGGTMVSKDYLRFRYHNGYLETLMKFGVLGSIIFASYFFAVLRLAFQVIRTSDNYFAKAIGIGLVVWLIPSLAASLAGSYFSDRGFALTVGVMAGLVPALVSQYDYGKEPKVARPEYILPKQRQHI